MIVYWILVYIDIFEICENFLGMVEEVKREEVKRIRILVKVRFIRKWNEFFKFVDENKGIWK